MVFFIFAAKKALGWAVKKHVAGKAGKSSAPSFSLFDLFVYFLPLPTILFYLLCFVGCLGTSPGIPNLYLVSMTSQGNRTGGLELSVGYFGVCARAGDGDRLCNSAVGRDPASLAEKLQLRGNDTATADLLAAAKTVQSRIFTPLSPAASLLFVLGLAAMLLLAQRLSSAASADVAGGGNGETAAARESRSFVMARRWTLALLWASTAFALMVALATTQAAAALEFVGEGFRRGRAVEGLQWTIAAMQTIFSVRVAYVHRRAGVVVARRPDAEKGMEMN